MQTIDKQTRDAWHAHDAALHAWMRTNNRNSYRPEELPAQLLPTLTNDQVERGKFENVPGSQSKRKGV